MEIFHHGIRGQKWGVRNGPPYPLDASRDTIIPKGAILYRVQSTSNEGDMDARGYYSASIDDHRIYVLRAKAQANLHEMYGNGYSAEYKLEKSIRLPGKIKARKLMREVLKNASDDDIMDGFFSFSRTYSDKKELADSMRKRFLTDSPKKWDMTHISFNQLFAVYYHTSKIKTEFIKLLKKNGYDGIFDYMDKDSFSKMPIILLDKHKIKNVSLKAIKEFDEDDLKMKVSDYLNNNAYMGLTLDKLLDVHVQK